MQQYGNSPAERLARIETKLDALTDVITAHVRSDEAIFRGTGGSDRGLVAEHDEMMTAFKWWRWIIGSALAALLVVVGEIFLIHFKA